MNFEGKQQSLLTFRVGPVLCCAPSLPVRSIITPPKLSQLPGSDSSQPGIFKHGSHIVKVFDLRQKFGIDKTEQTQPGNLIVTIFEGGDFAFWVDQILDVFDFPTEGWGNVPAAIPRGVFTKTLLLNKKIHLYCEFENLAKINDLGYLKQYLQQLKQHEEIKETVKSKTIPTPTKTTSLSETTNKPIENPIASTMKKDPSLTTPSTGNKTITASINATKPSSPLTKSLLNKKSDSTPVVKTTPISKLSVPNTTTTNTTEQYQTTSNKKTVLENSAREAIKPPPVPSIKKPIPLPSRTKENLVKIKTTYIKETENTDQEESSAGIVIFFLFMICLLGAGFYYFYFDSDTNKSKYKKSIIVKKHEPVKLEKIQPVDVEIPTTQIVESIVENDSAEEEVLEIQEYKADISQQENEITITIHQPISIEERLNDKSIADEPEKIENETKIEVSVNATPVDKLAEKEAIRTLPKEKIISEITHTVVKGDTLWAIAKKYVNNPFLYPELARLSNIKNPHRIYPGNRVRIRFIKR